jgi:Fe-S oxidoreductase
MATYKAEFLSHYYARRLRPRAAYSMGLIHWWARAASIAPSVVNLVTAVPPLSAMAKFAAGIAPQRKLPRFAKRTFRDRFRSTHSSGQRVILWPDTFTNYFHPRQGLAAAAVLESLGFSVVLPQQGLCCGRPLYDFGMLRPAKKLLRKILDELEPLIRQRVPVVGLEPSCIAVFRDELVNLFPNDERAKTLRQQSFLLTEFLDRNAADRSWPKLHGLALVHGHCHQKSILGMSHVDRMLQKLQADYQVLDSGCCGMAGSFGFEKHHYDVSQRIGERVLLPAVRSAGSDVLIIADGFSCREQIVQSTGRQPVHMAEVLAGVVGYEIS